MVTSSAPPPFMSPVPAAASPPPSSSLFSQLSQLAMPPEPTVIKTVQDGQRSPITPPPTPPSKGSWNLIAARKQADRESILARYHHWRLPSPIPPPSTLLDVSQLVLYHLTPQERTIVHSDATTITSKIRQREWSSVEVLTAFVKVTVAGQDVTNCITEIFFEEGFERARELDRHLERTGQTVGPLHGLPVSIKDHILVKGHDTSTGYIAWADQTHATKDAAVVDILRKAGAVLYVKTANPQTLLSLETNNNVFGRTLNPFNRKLSPGGSSGGESALIALHGSPMGVGTDIGGSIRVPAAYTGLYGFKPSVARMPHTGLLGSHDGMDNIVGVVGPLATSARDLELFCKTMCDYESWILEHQVLEMPWKGVQDLERNGEKLSFAMLWDDGVVKPHPPLVREMKRVKAALQAAGHEVIDWEPLEHQEGWDLIVKLYLLDGGKEYYDTMAESGEPAVPGTEWILSHAAGRLAYPVADTWKLNCEREGFRARGLQHWNATRHRTSTGRPIDGVICPTSCTLAIPHDKTRWWGYSSHWNLLDLPGVVFPSGGRLRPEEWTGREGEGWEKRNDVEKEVWETWDPETFRGAPITLQIVGRRHNEEKVLGMLGVVEKAMSAMKESELQVQQQL